MLHVCKYCGQREMEARRAELNVRAMENYADF